MQYIYCKVKQQIQRELSHIIKSRCACVWWIYMVVNLILLCSLKTYLSFETWMYLQENMGYLIHLSFLGGHLSTHCFDNSDTCPFFLNSFWIHCLTLQYMYCKYALLCYHPSYEPQIRFSCRKKGITLLLP